MLFIQELRLLRNWSDSEIRKITFRRGINVLWSDPCNEATEDTTNRVHGHAAGKTTFCRILRYLLGEKHFGTEDVEQRIRFTFPDGWAVMRVEVAGESWVLARDYFGRSVAVRAPSIDAVVDTPFDQLPNGTEFYAALNDLALKRVHRRQLPGKTIEVEWLHILPWLARDQESAFRKLCDWRDTTSESEARATSDDDRQFLVRLLLDLLSEEESASFDEQKSLNDSKRKASDELTVQNQGVEYLKGKVAGLVPGGAHGAEIGSMAFTQWKMDFLSSKPRTELGLHLPLIAKAREAEDNLNALTKAINTHYGRLGRLNEEAKELQTKLDGWSVKVRKAKEAELNENLGVPQGVCGRKREEAKGHCPLYQEVPISFSTGIWERKLEEERQQHEQDLARIKAEVVLIGTQLGEAESKLPGCREERDRAQEGLQKVVREDEARMAAWNQKLALFDDLVAEAEAVVTKKGHIDGLEKQIRELREDQKDMKSKVEVDRRVFSDLYDKIVKRICGTDLTGTITFKGKDLSVDVSETTPMRSGGVNALKYVCFDIAAMLYAAQGKGHHPAFLIHDSPRAADMAPLLYSQIFKFLGETEADCPEGSEPDFQYIITTTEPPPEGFTQKPYLLTDQPLRASIPGERLFKCNL